MKGSRRNCLKTHFVFKSDCILTMLCQRTFSLFMLAVDLRHLQNWAVLERPRNGLGQCMWHSLKCDAGKIWLEEQLLWAGSANALQRRGGMQVNRPWLVWKKLNGPGSKFWSGSLKTKAWVHHRWGFGLWLPSAPYYNLWLCSVSLR